MLKATITRSEVAIRIFNGKILELKSVKKSEYHETLDTTNVSDMGAFRIRFIESIAKKVLNQNRMNERKAIKNNSIKFEKLIVTKIE